jgi:hypothetical protein
VEEFNIAKHGWKLDGRAVEATYINRPVSGIVERSDVLLGGRISYTIKLHLPTEVHGTNRREVNVDHNDVHRVEVTS